MVAAPNAGRQALPSRSTRYSDRTVWLQEKGAADREVLGFKEGLWCYQGKVYDLSGYMDSHPGGRDWLELTRGMDVSELVITHHLHEDKLKPILQKYYVCDAVHPPTKSSRCNTFSSTGLYRQLKERVSSTFRATDTRTHAPPWFNAFACVILCAWVCAFTHMCVTGSMASVIVAGVLLNPILGLGHNYMHQRPTWLMYCLDLTLFSSYEWKISHCISHHTYPNTAIDFEVSALEPLIYTLRSGPTNSPILWLLLWLLMCILGLYEFGARWILIITAQRKLRPENLLNVLQLVGACIGQGWASGVYMWTIMHVINSLLLAAAAFPVHHSTYAWVDGMPDAVQDFGEHILLTTQDYADECPVVLSLVLYGMFNLHSVHHMFPTIDHSRLHTVRGLLREVCRERRIEYMPYSHVHLVAGTLYRWLWERWEGEECADQKVATVALKQ